MREGSCRHLSIRSEVTEGDLAVDTDRALIDIVLRYLAKTPRNICVFEDPIAGASDPDIGLDGDRSRACGDSIYLLLDARAGAQDVRHTLSLARPAYPPFVAILTGVQDLPLPVGALTPEDLRAFASGTKAILVGAYDGEGFAMWEPGQSKT